MKQLLFGLVLVLGSGPLFAQDSSFIPVSLNDLSQFRTQSGNWVLAGNVIIDPTRDVHDTVARVTSVAAPEPKKKRRRKEKQQDTVAVAAVVDPVSITPGKGIIVNDTRTGKKDNLVTTWQHGDIELELDVMVPKGSNSGIYLQGGYEVQVFDSWRAKHASYGDMGGIYRNWEKDSATIYLGKAPSASAAKAPGLWQHLSISFRAPRFDGSGKKISNARFVYVKLNNVLIHEQIEVPQLTGGPLDNKEKAMGPLMIQGDHGSVALRNIRYKLLNDTKDSTTQKVGALKKIVPPEEMVSPVLVDVGNETKLLRAFYDFRGMGPVQRLTRTIAVGDPDGMHYIYNLGAGNIAAVWRGDFIDATPMWHQRGDGSFMTRGVTQLLSAGPSVAELADSSAAFPAKADSLGFRSLGYTVHDRPAFQYNYKGNRISDRIWPDTATGAFIREISFDSLASKNLYVKVAEGKSIDRNPGGDFLIDDKSWYIRLSAPEQAIIRTTAGGAKELLVKVVGQPVRYSIIW